MSAELNISDIIQLESEKESENMNNFDLWKWVAGKRTDKEPNYSKKNWLYVGLMLLLFILIVLSYYFISVLW